MSFQYFSGQVRGLRGPGLTVEQQGSIDTAIQGVADLSVVVGTKADKAEVDATIGALQANIEDEGNLRFAGDQEIRTDLTAGLTAESAARTAAVSALSDNITQEGSIRDQGDRVLRNGLDPIKTATSGNGIFGKAGAPASGSGASEGLYLFAAATTAPGILRRLVVYAATPGTITFKRMRYTDTTVTEVDPSPTYPAGGVPIVIASSGLQTIEVNASFGQNELIGLYAPDNTLMFSISAGAPLYVIAGGNVSSATLPAVTLTIELQVRFEIEYTLVTLQRAQRAGAVADKLLGAASDQVRLGAPGTPNAGSGGSSAGVYLMASRTTSPGVMTALDIYCFRPGTIWIKRMRVSGENAIEVSASATYPSGGVPVVLSNVGRQIIPLDITFEADELIGFYVPENRTTFASTTGAGIYFAPGGNASNFALPAINTGFVLQAALSLSYISAIASRLTTLESSSQEALGVQTTPSAGAGSNSEGIYLLPVATTISGIVKSVSVYVYATGTIMFKRFNAAGVEVGPVGGVPVVLPGTGVQNIPVSLPFGAGEFIGFYSPDGRISFASSSTGEGTRYIIGGNVSNITIPAVNTSLVMQFALKIATPRQPLVRQALSLDNGDKIVCLGNSFTRSTFQPRGKS